MKTNFFKSALLALLCAAIFAGCVRIELPVPEPQTVYASFYPIYALAAGVCENVPGLTLSCLTQPQDGCLRSYELSDWDYQLLDEGQEDTAVQKWLLANSWRYGFILRYPTEKTNVTGIIYEPWHYRYVGKERAKQIYDSGLCLEEWLALD